MSFIPLLFATQPAIAQTITILPYSTEQLAHNVVNELNLIRNQSGLSSLAVHPLLNQAAYNHAVDIATYNNYSHTGADGSDVRTRVLRTGYPTDGWVGENWAGVPDPTQVVAAWMASPGHRDNILRREYNEIGIGVTYHAHRGLVVFVTVFSRNPTTSPPLYGQVAAAAVQQPTPIPPTPVPYYTPTPVPPTPVPYYTPTPVPPTPVPPTPVPPTPVPYYTPTSVPPTPVPPAPIQPTQPASSAYTSSLSYTVQRGDTLSSIANRHSVPWRIIAEANNLTNPNYLSVGQILVIPVQ